MKFLILLVATVALSRANDDTARLQLAADNPQKLQALFTEFRKENNRQYLNPVEARMRMSIFRNFVKEAANINANQDDITVGVTFFADLTAEEKAAYHGANFTTQHGEVQESVEEAAPAFWGSVSHKHHYGPIKQQGTCGSCWAFATVGMTEGWQSKLTGRYTSLSEKQVLDCSGCGTCHSGYHTNAMNWIKSRNNLASTYSYPYRPVQERCQNGKPNSMTIRVNSVSTVYGDSNMARALNSGPVVFFLFNFHGVAVEGYKSGVLQAHHHGPSAPQNHVVVGVGYTSSSWEMRNSWGTNWGQRGYFFKSRGDSVVASNVLTMSAARLGQEEKEE